MIGQKICELPQEEYFDCNPSSREVKVGIRPVGLQINTQGDTGHHGTFRERTNVMDTKHCISASEYTPDTSYTFGIPNPTTFSSSPSSTRHFYFHPDYASQRPRRDLRYARAQEALSSAFNQYAHCRSAPRDSQVRALEVISAWLTTSAHDARKREEELDIKLKDRSLSCDVEPEILRALQHERWMIERRCGVLEKEEKIATERAQSLKTDASRSEKEEKVACVNKESRRRDNLVMFFERSSMKIPVRARGRTWKQIYLERSPRRMTVKDLFTPMRSRSSLVVPPHFITHWDPVMLPELTRTSHGRKSGPITHSHTYSKRSIIRPPRLKTLSEATSDGSLTSASRSLSNDAIFTSPNHTHTSTTPSGYSPITSDGHGALTYPYGSEDENDKNQYGTALIHTPISFSRFPNTSELKLALSAADDLPMNIPEYAWDLLDELESIADDTPLQSPILPSFSSFTSVYTPSPTSYSFSQSRLRKMRHSRNRTTAFSFSAIADPPASPSYTTVPVRRKASRSVSVQPLSPLAPIEEYGADSPSPVAATPTEIYASGSLASRSGRLRRTRSRASLASLFGIGTRNDATEAEQTDGGADQRSEAVVSSESTLQVDPGGSGLVRKPSMLDRFRKRLNVFR